MMPIATTMPIDTNYVGYGVVVEIHGDVRLLDDEALNVVLDGL